MHFDDPVIGLAALSLVGQKAAPLHEPQMFGGHVAGYAAGLGQFSDRVAVAKQHLHHPQPMGMGQGLQAFRRLLQGVQRRQRGQFFGESSIAWSFQLTFYVTQLYRNISTCQYINLCYVPQRNGWLQSASLENVAKDPSNPTRLGGTVTKQANVGGPYFPKNTL